MENMEILCLDTDILIDYLRGNPEISKKIMLLDKEFELTTTTINLFELYYGAFKTRNTQRNVDAVRTLARRVRLLEFTEKSAELSGQINAQLEKQGTLVGFRDTMIGGIVLENNALLYTKNLKHFKEITKIKLYKPK